MRRSRPGPVVAAVLVLLAGCAGPGRLLRPSDFPRHETSHRFLDLHWRLERGEDGIVKAVGLVEAARMGGIDEVIVELRGLDAAGRVVSRGFGRMRGTVPLRIKDTRPFTVELRPSGLERRYDLRVYSFSWHTGNGGGGRFD